MSPPNLRLSLSSLVGLALLWAGPAWGGRFQVTPTKVTLSPASSTAMLTLRNAGSAPLRFHVTAFAWSQSTTGQINLQESDEVIVYPSLLSVAPGKSRNLRIGTTAQFGATEKSYRIFVTELPAFRGQSAAAGASSVRVLTRMGIPVFLAPHKQHVKARIEAGRQSDGRLTFAVVNQGSIHFRLRNVEIVGKDASSDTVVRHDLKGWYVLPGDERAYSLDIGQEECSRLASFEITAYSDRGNFVATLPVPSAACAR